MFTHPQECSFSLKRTLEVKDKERIRMSLIPRMKRRRTEPQSSADYGAGAF
jgi:hypothetical protein